MASTSERTIAQYIHNSKIVIERCVTFSSQYNPSNALLAIANLNATWSSAFGLHEALTAIHMTTKHPINERQDFFKRAVKIVTRSYNYYLSTNASEQAMRDAKGLADRFRGHGVKVKRLADGSKDPNHVSNSRQGFSAKTDFMRQLAQFYASDPNYAPNELDLQVGALMEMANEMQEMNDNLSGLLAPLGAARIARDKALYDESTGLFTLMRAVKLYVKSVFGASSAEYRSVSGFLFRSRGL